MVVLFSYMSLQCPWKPEKGVVELKGLGVKPWSSRGVAICLLNISLAFFFYISYKFKYE